MKSPNIFLHYWANKDSIMTFQDILGQDIPTEILEKIQIEIQRQLNSEKLPEIIPCFDWENERFLERWEALSKTLVLQVQLPKIIWENWVNELGLHTPNSEIIEFNPFEDSAFGSFELSDHVNPLLSAEVYFEKREELEEMEEIKEERKKEKEERREEREERNEEIKEELKEETREKREERNEEIKVDSKVETKLESKETLPKNILEELQINPKEKFFETISVTDSSLIKLVESKMTVELSQTISINQKIQFILQLFDGDSTKFNELIVFIDQEANASNWQNELNERYASYQNQSNLEAWKNLYLLVQRKFN